MGMLMHHTWLKQQEAEKAKTVVEEEIPFTEPEEPAEKPVEPTVKKAATAKKAVSRRKSSK